MKKQLQRARTKFLSAYYGHSSKDLKIICVTGTTGKTTVSHYIHDILDKAGYKVNALETHGALKAGILHKFLNDTWKSGAEYAIIAASASDIASQVFYDLPIYAVAMTNCIPSSLTEMSHEQQVAERRSLFETNPAIVVLNTDDAHYQEFSKFAGTTATYTYGTSMNSDVRIDNFQLYRKGTEANLAINNRPLTTATFVVGEPAVSYMACAAAVAASLKIKSVDIIAGIGEYTPEQL